MEAGRKAIAPSGIQGSGPSQPRGAVPLPRGQSTKQKDASGPRQLHDRPDIPRHYNDEETRVTCPSMYRTQMPCAGGQQTGADHQDEGSTNAGQRQQCSNRKRTPHPARQHAPKRACRWNSKQRLFCTRSFRTKPGVEYNARWEQQLQMMMLI